MKKWYIGTFIVFFTLLTFVNGEQVTLPNQEIVLQFRGSNLTSEDTQITIALVKKELQDVGVNNVHVKENEKGRLKITYYSDTDVASVKSLLLKRIRSDLDTTSDDDDPFNFPSEEKIIGYNLDVYEIQKTADSDSDFNRIAVLEIDLKGDRFSKPKVFTAFLDSEAKTDAIQVALAFRINRIIAIAIKNSLQYIPEGRAGPVC